MPKKVNYDTYIIEKYGKYERKRKAEWVNCDYCDIKFLKQTRFIQEYNYCCKEHSALKNRKRIEVTCAYCGSKKEVTQSRYDISKTKTFFCCRDHQNKAQKISYEKVDYVANYTNGYYANKNNRTNNNRIRNERTTFYRIAALEKYPHKCVYCGYDKKNILIVHHIDYNRKNNSIENLIILCRNCHYAIHSGLAILEDRKLKWLN